MRLISLIFIILLFSGCGATYKIGLAYTSHDEVENPLAVLRVDKQFSDHFSGSCEHISTAFEAHDVLALDHCGIFYNF